MTRDQPTFTGEAPGRLDVMGGIADYSGSLVLQMPIREKTKVVLTLRDDFECIIHSTVDGEVFLNRVDYRSLLKDGLVDFNFARERLAKGNMHWSAYILGCVLVLDREKGIEFRGAEFTIDSSVPLGKGVSSSASLEVAVMKALCDAFEVHTKGTELAVLAQKVENYVVGAPCGLMDQLSTCYGVPGKLLPIICQPDIVGPPIEIPENIHFLGIDSGVRHSVGGSSYVDVRCAAFMGYTIIATSKGTSREEITRARLEGALNLPYRGYLCNITPHEFEEKYARILPKLISGQQFLDAYGATIDLTTTINPLINYQVSDCASHPVYENQRVKDFIHFINMFRATRDKEHLQKLGKLMAESHLSYSRCGLGSSRTDEIVALTKTKFTKNIHGAKITGGGSGGTVCVLAEGEEGIQTVGDLHTRLCELYQEELTLIK